MFKNPRNEAPTKYRPSFKKYGAKDFKFLRVLGKGRWANLCHPLQPDHHLVPQLWQSSADRAARQSKLLCSQGRPLDLGTSSCEWLMTRRWRKMQCWRTMTSSARWSSGKFSPWGWSTPSSVTSSAPSRQTWAAVFFLISDNHPSLNVRDNIFQLSVPVTPILRDGVPERRRSHVPHPTTGQVSLSKYSCHSVQNFWVPLVHRTLVTTYSFSHRMPHLTAV